MIFTHDPDKFRGKRYVEMYDTIDTLPTTGATTFILHSDKFKEKDAIQWLPLIEGKLVVVCSKPPKLTSKKEIAANIIIDSNFPKTRSGFSRQMQSLLRWSDRHRAFLDMREVPVPVMINYGIANRPQDIDTWRLLSKAGVLLPEDYSKAILCFGLEPSSDKINWPNKKKKEVDIPFPFRATDKYWEEILKSQPSVANQIRDVNADIPAVIKKRKEEVREWL